MVALQSVRAPGEISHTSMFIVSKRKSNSMVGLEALVYKYSCSTVAWAMRGCPAPLRVASSLVGLDDLDTMASYKECVYSFLLVSLGQAY